MKVNNVPGTFNWKIWWDSNGGSNFTYVDTFDASSQYGYAYGEAARGGRTGTDIIDHHWNMQFKNSGGNWQDFNTLNCWNDTDADYIWDRVSDNEFRVKAGSQTC